MTEKNYFVKIDENKDLLKGILNGSKLSIEFSQSYYKLLEIRREKTDLFFRLKAQVVELLQYSKFLEEELPYADLLNKKLIPKKKDNSKKTPSKSKTVKKSSNSKKTSKSNDAMSKLSESLLAIEEKLKNLD